MLYSRVYYMNESFAGYIADIVFDRNGFIVALVVARILLPLVKVGLKVFIVPYRLVGVIKGSYHILAPRHLLSLREFLYTYVDTVVVEYAYGGRVERISGLLGLTIFATLLLILAFMHKSIGIILYLIATAIMLTLPFLADLFLRTTIPGYYTLRSIIGSKVYDSNGYLIGVIGNLVLDTDKGVISSLIVVKPVHARTSIIEEIYHRVNRLSISLNHVHSISNGAIYLNVPYTILLDQCN